MSPIKVNFKQFVMFAIFMFATSIAFGQANITIEVRWDNWSSENRVTFRNPANNQIGASICNPGACFNGAGNNSYNNLGSPASYAAIPYGNNYDILLQDTFGDGWNGFSYVRVYQDGVLIVDSDLTGGSSTVVSFNIQPLPSSVIVNDVTANEDDGTIDFTVTHSGGPSAGPYTLIFETVAGTATSGTDYTPVVGGTLNFDGTTGDTETITISLIDDTLYEVSETFTIQFTASSDVTLDISDTGLGTIDDDEVILNNTDLVLVEEFDGYIGYTSTGGSLRTQNNNANPCSVTTTSSNTLTSAIPAVGVVDRAFLYWAHSGQAPDSQVTFEGVTVDADLMYTSSAGSGRIFYGGVSDVTSIVAGIVNLNTNSFDFSGLTIDTSATYCNSATVLGGWSLMVFYTDVNLPASTINLYQGFHGESNSTSTYTLDGFFAIGATGSKTTVLSWEGDQTLSNNEDLEVTTGLGTFDLTGDGDNSLFNRNPFNSTIYDNTGGTVINITTSYGVDLDTYDVSPFITAGESSVTTRVQSGQDFVVLNAVVLKVPSNLVTGIVYEDLNYGGGPGRDFATAPGVRIEGVDMELYDSGGTLIRTTTTDTAGEYVFGGMANGTYSIRALNNTISSTRAGGSACSACIPVQTFKTDYLLSTLTADNNSVGGENPSGTDSGSGTLAGAQSISSMTIFNEGVDGMDFGFNFNTIVNSNENGQGSLEQFIVNSNALDATVIDIEANGIFNPAAGDDTSIFMIPTTGDPLGRTADANFANGYFNISISNANPLSNIIDNNTSIDGRTQTAYSSDTNTGTIGSGGTSVGTSNNILPNFERPEVQVYRPGGDVINIQGNNTTIRNIAVYANNNAGIRIQNGSASILNNIIGVNALGAAVGNIDSGVELIGGSAVIDGNFISDNTNQGIWVNGGTSTVIQNNEITTNGNGACNDNISIQSGTGVLITQNLISNAASFGIEIETGSGGIVVSENTIISSGQDGGNCGSSPENAGIMIIGNNSEVTNNIIASSGGAGIVVGGGNTSGNLISQNSIYANGTFFPALGIDIDATGTSGDGVTLNETGDVDNGPNGSLNFPVISNAIISGAFLKIRGWSRPGAVIEFFFTDINEGTATAGDNQFSLTTDYGEGQLFIGSVIEGAASDLDANILPYTDLDGNTDNTNRFEFNLPLPAGIIAGEFITSTATVANSTSEFSPQSIIKIPTLITNRKITYRIKKD